MIYEYKCCGEIFEVIKPLAECRTQEQCPMCGGIASRIISRASIVGADDWDNATYCPALGQEVKSNKHRAQLAKERGLVEIGNEDMTKVAKEYSDDRSREAAKKMDEAASDAYNYYGGIDE